MSGLYEHRVRSGLPVTGTGTGTGTALPAVSARSRALEGPTSSEAQGAERGRIGPTEAEADYSAPLCFFIHLIIPQL